MRTRLIFALLLYLPLVCTAEFSAQVDRTTLSINETLTLTLSTNTQVDTSSVSLAVLNNDFDILATSPQSSVSIINGRQSAQTRWVVTLLPKHTGTLVIPAFTLNGETTNPISIEVNQVSQRVGDSPITAQVEVEDPTIYVNEELIVTVSLISSPQVSSLSGEQLTIDNADVTLLDQRSFSRQVNGENWTVNQWQYAVFSRTEGRLNIAAQTFSGVVGGSSRTPFSPFGSAGRRILARSEPLAIEVLAPPTASQAWLPAREFSLEVIWSGNPNTLEVGEPMTRTIVSSAIGQQASALPPLSTAANSQYKVYADQPQMNEQPRSNSITSERRDSAAIVPSQAGEIEFPEIRVPWWDIESETWQEAVLPAETIQVSAASVAVPQLTPGIQTPQARPVTEPPVDIAPEVVVERSSSTPFWKWGLGILFACTLLLGMDNIRLRRNRGGSATPGATPKEFTEKQQWKTLMESVKLGQPEQIRRNLLSWADLRWPKKAPHNLHILREQDGGNIDELLRHLETLCSDKDSMEFDRKAFGSSLQNWHSELANASVQKKNGLPELYPK